LNGRKSVQRWRNQKASQYTASTTVGIERSIAVEMDDIESSNIGRRLHMKVPEQVSGVPASALPHITKAFGFIPSLA
jgi:hypothetical protein